MPAAPEPVYFREAQRPYWWVYVLALVVAAVVAYLTFNTGQSGPSLILAWAFGMVGIPLLTFSLRLKTELRGDRLIVEMAPLWTREVPLTDVVSAEAVTYRPFLHFGGWGIRYSFFTKQWAYVIRGKDAVLLELVGKKPLLVGTGRAGELAEAIVAVQRGS